MVVLHEFVFKPRSTDEAKDTISDAVHTWEADLGTRLRVSYRLDNRRLGNYRVLYFEVSISAPRLDLGSKFQQILTLVRARSIWDFQLLGAKARTRAMAVDFSDALNVQSIR
jgi:hypothetical protein